MKVLLLPIIVSIIIIISGELFKLLAGLNIKKTFLVILNEVGKFLFNALIIYGMVVLLWLYKEVNSTLAFESTIYNFLLLLYFVFLTFGLSYYIWLLYKKIYKEFNYSLIPTKGSFRIILINYLLLMVFYVLIMLVLIILLDNDSELNESITTFSISNILISPFVEEILYRFGLYLLFFTLFRKFPKIGDEKNRIISLILMTTFFVIMHGKYSITHIMFSVILFNTMEKTKSIGATIILHLMFNVSFIGLFRLMERLL